MYIKTSDNGHKQHTNSAVAADGQTHIVSELSEGIRIRHGRFGTGTLVKIHSNEPEPSITVQFDLTGTKKLLLKFARFNILN